MHGAGESGRTDGDATAPAPARERILRATVERILAAGVAHLSMQDVADAAGVSKGLIHYHFHDKDALLAHVVEWTAAGLVTRERAALAGAPSARAVDALWEWLDAELRAGRLRVLIELSHEPGQVVRAAVQEGAQARRAAAADSIDTLFRRLSLKPRIPVPLLAGVTVAFIDGLAMESAIDAQANLRVSFDVFWLAMLNMAE